MVRSRDLPAIDAEAIAWVQKISSGESGAQDAEAASRWRSQSAAHEAAFAEASRVWGTAQSAARVLTNGDDDILAQLDRLRDRRTLGRRAVLGGGTAMLALAAYGSVHPPFGLWPSLSEFSADYRTDTGVQKQVTVAGDIAVDLNTQTSLTLRPADGGASHVELVAGEAAFWLPSNTHKTLIVSAGSGRTVVQTGRFNIRISDSSDHLPVNVTCLEGRGRIELGGQGIDLVAAQCVRYGDHLSQVTPIDLASASEWQRGIVEFRDMPLGEAIAEINRYRPGRIILASRALGHKRLSGRFRISQMDLVLTQLEQSFSATLRHLPGGVVILS